MEATDLLPPATLAALERVALVVRRLPGRSGGEVGRGRPGGFGLDFHEYLPYAPGTDLRRNDWRRWQATGDLLVRTDLDRRGHPVLLVVDTSGSMGLGAPNKLDFSTRVAAALAFAALRAGHPVGVVAFSGAAGRVLPARTGLQWLDTLLRFLASLRPDGRTDLAAGLQGALARGRGQGRVVLLSDLLDPAGATAALDGLAGPRRAVDVVEVTARGEEELPVGETVEARDPETGERRTLTISTTVAAAFAANLAATRRAVRDGCPARGLVHVRADSADDPVAVVRALAAARVGE